MPAELVQRAIRPLSRPTRRGLVKAAVLASFLVWIADLAYQWIANVNYVSRERCVLFRALPKAGFLVWEYVFETLVMVLVGTFLAVLAGRWFLRLRRFYPRNPVTGFLAGAVLPVCSCAAIPLVAAMRGKLRFSTTMAFVLAAPLLSPYIAILSFTVLGWRYGLLRILASFLTVMVTVHFLELIHRGDRALEPLAAGAGCGRACSGGQPDAYQETLAIFKRLLPLVLAAAVLGVALELLGPRLFLLRRVAGEGPAAVAAWVLLGVPLYFCNGAEVLFLRPLLNHGFPVGTAIAFSISATAVCATSIAMLLKLLGARTTIALLVCLLTLAFAAALAINALI
jgi:uncharacterized membrane protein YraQ (UPF0718 family)